MLKHTDNTKADRPWVAKCGLVSLVVCTPSAARASDFGCIAEWLDLAVMVASIPAGAACALVALWLKPAMTLPIAAGTWLVLALSVMGTTCHYGHDQDLIALGLLTIGALLPALVAAAKQVRRQA